LQKFTWDELADWYLEIHKIEKNDKVLGYILDKIMKLWHPFMPFVTEKIWQDLQANKSLLMIQKWPEADKKLLDKKAEKEFANLKEIVYKIRNVRSNYHIEPAKVLNVYAQKIKEKEIIEKLGRVKIEKNDKIGERMLEIGIAKFSLKINLAEYIDISKELKSAEKEIGNLEKLIAKSEATLKNKNFLKNAPKEIVESSQNKLREYKEKLKIQIDLRKSLEILD
jgi:valyl-tRNA synthetase